MPGSDDNQERADRILDAAVKLIVHYGYDKTTVSDIAREAGVSKGAIYLHWAGKDELFEALIMRESERMAESMLSRIEADSEAGSIFSLYQHAIMVTLANPLIHAFMTKDQRVIGDYSRRSSQSKMMLEGNMIRNEMVRQLQESNVIRADLDADVVAYIMALIRYGFLTIHEVIPNDQAPPLETVGKTLGLMLERALAPDGGVDAEAGKQVLERIVVMVRDLVRSYR